MSADLDRLRDIMALLRDPEKGCPWDVEQTFASIAPHTIEEAYEVADAVERGDMPHLEEELGDLLLQVVFFARMAEEDGVFDLDGVARAICAKLVSRHPHVFADAKIKDAKAQLRAWEGYKAREREEERNETAANGVDGQPCSALDGVAMALPALTRAVKLQKRAARVGFDWDEAAGVLGKMAEETAELGREMAVKASFDRIEDETGDLLFTCVNLARKLGVNPEHALRRANAKFDARFRHMERAAAADGADFAAENPDKLEERWQRAKEEY
jgi:MazG family protein